jgi:hypothetical protein
VAHREARRQWVHRGAVRQVGAQVGPGAGGRTGWPQDLRAPALQRHHGTASMQVLRSAGGHARVIIWNRIDILEYNRIEDVLGRELREAACPGATDPHRGASPGISAIRDAGHMKRV